MDTEVNVRYVHKIAPRDTDTDGPFKLPEGAYSDRKTLGRALRHWSILGPGERLKGFRVEGDRVICFPAASIWHSIILTFVPPVDGAR